MDLVRTSHLKLDRSGGDGGPAFALGDSAVAVGSDRPPRQTAGVAGQRTRQNRQRRSGLVPERDLLLDRAPRRGGDTRGQLVRRKPLRRRCSSTSTRATYTFDTDRPAGELRPLRAPQVAA